MPDVAIMTDSNSGITQAQAEKLGVEVIPMPVLIDGREFFEGVNLSYEQFFDYLKADADVKTSLPSPAVLTETWDRLLQEHEEVLYIPMSSGLSNSCMTAMGLAQEYEGRVVVVDNRRISVPQYQTVIDAGILAGQGLRAAEIRDELEREADRFSVYIAVDTMKYLKKGGRVSGTAAVLGTMLNIKPVLYLGSEKLDAAAKCRGTKAAHKAMIEALKKDLEGKLKPYREQGTLRIMTAYTNISEEEIEKWNQEVREAFQVDYVETAPLTLSISCHVGPGAVALGASYTRAKIS